MLAICPAFSTIKTASYIVVSEVWLPIVSYINGNLFKGMSWSLLVQHTSLLSVGHLRPAECWDDQVAAKCLQLMLLSQLWILNSGECHSG